MDLSAYEKLTQTSDLLHTDYQDVSIPLSCEKLTEYPIIPQSIVHGRLQFTFLM